jgi:hypothetical protein
MHQMTEVTAVGRPKKQGMHLAFIPLSLTFENIRYSVDMPKVIMLYNFIIHVNCMYIDRKN